MIGWIIYKKSAHELKWDTDHAVMRLIEEAKLQHIELRVYQSNDISFNLTSGHITFLYHGFKITAPDFVIARRGANTCPSCYLLLHALRAQGAILINSPESIALAQDKILSGIYLAKNNISIPNTQLINNHESIQYSKAQASFPLIVKKLMGKRGTSVIKCASAENFEDTCSIIGLNNGALLAQEFVSSSYGKDLRVFVINNKAIACMQRMGKNGSYKSNFSLGGSVCAFEITDHIADISIKASSALQLDIAGVDLLFSEKEGKFTVCEVNSSPGFKGLEIATNMNIAKNIIDYIIERVKNS